jgi:hypothetical protein
LTALSQSVLQPIGTEPFFGDGSEHPLKAVLFEILFAVWARIWLKPSSQERRRAEAS